MSDCWRDQIDLAMAQIETSGRKSLEVRQAAMPLSKFSRRKVGNRDRSDWKAYVLTKDQKAIVNFLRDCGPNGADKKALYKGVYAPRNIKPFRIDQDVNDTNRLLQSVGFWIRCGRERTGKRWIEKIQPLSNEGLPVLLEDFVGIDLENMEPQVKRLLRHFLDAGARGASKPEIIDDLWGHDPEGGPLTAEAVVVMQIHRLRRALAPNYVIRHYGYGGRYMLQIIATKEEMANAA